MNQFNRDDNWIDRPPRRLALFYFQVLLSFITGGIALTLFAVPSAGLADPHRLLLASILFGYTIVSLVFNFGWTIPCIVAATLWQSSGILPAHYMPIARFTEVYFHAPLAGLIVGLTIDFINPAKTRCIPKRQSEGDRQPLACTH